MIELIIRKHFIILNIRSALYKFMKLKKEKALMNICFTILILFIFSAGAVYSQEEDFLEPTTKEPTNNEPSTNNPKEKIKNKPTDRNSKKNIIENSDKNLNAKGKENSADDQNSEAMTEDTVIIENEISDVDTVSVETPISEEKISEEELKMLSTLKGEDHSKAISEFSQEELRALSKISAGDIAKVLNITESEAKKIKDEIILNTVKPYDKTPIDAPEAITSIPGVGLAINAANDILTAGLDMTPKQRKKAQTVVLIILILVILPESYRLNNSKNKK